MRIDKQEKDVMLGAFFSTFVDTLNDVAEVLLPADVDTWVWYEHLHPMALKTGKYLNKVLVQALMSGAAVLTRNPRTKQMLKDMNFGGLLYNAPDLVRLQGSWILYQKSLPVGHSGRLPSPYVTTPEVLPFQTDPGY